MHFRCVGFCLFFRYVQNLENRMDRHNRCTVRGRSDTEFRTLLKRTDENVRYSCSSYSRRTERPIVFYFPLRNWRRYNSTSTTLRVHSTVITYVVLTSWWYYRLVISHVRAPPFRGTVNTITRIADRPLSPIYPFPPLSSIISLRFPHDRARVSILLTALY